jgi:hypothetical protein
MESIILFRYQQWRETYSLGPIYQSSEVSFFTCRLTRGITSRLVGSPTANPISHPPKNAIGKKEVHPTCTETIVKVITVSKTNTMKKASKRFEYLALNFTTRHHLKDGRQERLSFVYAHNSQQWREIRP